VVLILVFLQNTIPIKEGMKQIMQEQGSINSAFKETFQKELEKFIKARMIFLVHPEWVSNWELASRINDNIITRINLRTFRQAIMINPFPPLSMEWFYIKL
jgi:hypothetical protein